MEGATTTDYVLHGQGVVRTLVNNVVDRTYLHGARGPEYERIGANDPLWYLYDGHGSVLGTVDQNGTVVSTRKYDVYGAVRGSTGPGGTKHKFVGSLGHPSEDETGLVYMRARYQDPVTGRFNSLDPGRHGNNFFVYASNNPVNRVDSTAKWDQVVFDEARTGWLYGLAGSKEFRVIAFFALLSWESEIAWQEYHGVLTGNPTPIIGGGLKQINLMHLWGDYKSMANEPESLSPGNRVKAFWAGYSAVLTITALILDQDQTGILGL